ncbi:recombinase family protein [Micromonospora coxensis]|uniref:recombinase family protein n=1 Tax=Micromonospora coxensis TaxID=356852 RepID=UPI003419BDC8
MSHQERIADLYLRLSLDREGKTAIERQEFDCRAWAERNGLEVRKVHIDQGRSGYKPVDRAGFDAAISALTTGTVGTLVVWKVDRLSRHGMSQVGQVLDQVDKAGGRIVFGGCGGRMSAAGRSYVCQGRRLGRPCPAHTTAFIAAVDRAVVDAFGTRLAATGPGDPLLDAIAERWVTRHHPEIMRERATIQAALDDADARLVDLEEARYLRGEFQGPEPVKRWDRLHNQLTARVNGLRHNLAHIPLPRADISPLLKTVRSPEAWSATSVDDQRNLLVLALDAVIVRPAEGRRGYRFDPDARLQFVWAVEPEPAPID